MSELTRRTLLRGAAGAAVAGPLLWRQAAVAGAAPVEQVHLQFGDDPARDMTVSWVTAAPVKRPRVRVGTPRTGPGDVVAAETRTYRDASTGTEVFTHHVRLRGLRPDTEHVYAVEHDGAPSPVAATFRTAPAGPSRFRFTSFGDQGTGTSTDRLSTPFGAYVVDQIERQQPLFHLLNGDLAYSDLDANPVGAWTDFFRNNQRSAARRPWMPTLGNHENETGNGPQGFASYLTRFGLPGNGSRDFDGNWYAFTVGNVRFVAVDNDDVALQDAGNFYVNGYSAGAQRRWLERTLAAARNDSSVDWVVVFMHHCLVSSAGANGSDLGVRESWQDLFDRYGVDLVLSGHDHDYERSHVLQGWDPASPTRTPLVASHAPTEIDAIRGTVYLVLGGGGSYPLNEYAGIAPPAMFAKVVTGRSTQDIELERAEWSAVRDTEWAFGFATFDVDPGHQGGRTTIRVTYQRTAPSSAGEPTVFDTFTLHRPRRSRPTTFAGR